MAKKSMIMRDKKRQKLYQKYAERRALLKTQWKNAESFEDKFNYHRKLQRLPLNSSPTRLKNRCFISGRPKAYYRFFGLSRHMLREMAHEGLLPGVRKASW